MLGCTHVLQRQMGEIAFQELPPAKPQQRNLSVQAHFYEPQRLKSQEDCGRDEAGAGDEVVQTIFSKCLGSKYGSNRTIIWTFCQICVLDGRTCSVGIARPKSVGSCNCIVNFESYKSTLNSKGYTSPRRDFFSKSSPFMFIKILAVVRNCIEY